MNQLGPNHNSLDWKDAGALFPHTRVDFKEHTESTATPRYSLRILQDILMRHHAEVVAKATKEYKQNFKEAVLLFKTWLRQRGMTSRTFGAFNGFTATMLLLHLIQQHGPSNVPRQVTCIITTSRRARPVGSRQLALAVTLRVETNREHEHLAWVFAQL